MKWIDGKNIVKKIKDGVWKCKDDKKFEEEPFELAHEKYLLCENELRRRGMQWEVAKEFDTD